MHYQYMPEKFLFLTLLFFVFPFTAKTENPADTVYIEEVVVTASRIEVSRRNIPVTLSTVGREEIEMSNESAVLPVLSQRIPGMFVTERGVTGFGVASGSAGQISMRGVGGTAPNTQVLVLIDGHPQFQGIFAHPFPDAYVSSDVEKVEVIRGPASILYGSNAMGGAINIITRQQDQKGFSGNARLSYGSFNTRKYMASGGYKDDTFSVFASINHDHTDGHRDTSEFNIVNAYIKASYQMNKHIDVMVDFGMADFSSEDPGTIYNPSFFGIDIMRGKASLKVNNRFDNLEGGLTAFYNFGDHDFTDGWVSRDYHGGLSIYQGLELMAGNRLTIGADYKTVAGKANRGVPGATDTWHDITDIATYAFVQQTLFEKWIMSGGIRLENNSMFGVEMVPQFGFSYLASGQTTIKGSLSKGFRSPTLMELYLFAPNPALQPERIMNYELGANRVFPDIRLQIEVAAFYIEGENMIQVVSNDTPPPPMIRKNVGSFNNTGIEMEANWQANRQLHVSLNYSYLNMDNPRLASPEHQFFTEVVYRNRNLRANLSLQRIAGLYTLIGENGNVSEDYTLLNLMLTYRLNQFIEVFASGKNLLDKTYTINHGYPMPGMHFNSGLNLRF